MDAGDSFAVNTILNGRYRVLRKLGQGGMGAVHLVADTLDEDRLLALKTVRAALFEEQGDQRLRDEFAAMAELRHPNVVEVYDFGAEGATGDHFFTMEFIDGTGLREACAAASPRRIYRYAAQICAALAYIHAQGYIHFDLKPDNIMVASTGAVKVMDFGLVGKGCFFEARILQGTAAYMAPEMIAGLPVDHRIDLYALGVILFRVVTGRNLFRGVTTVEVLYRHINEAPDLVTGLPRPLPEPLRPILERLLRKKPDERYASAAEVLSDIERLIEDEAPRDEARPHRVALGRRFVGREAEVDALKSAFQRRVLSPSLGAPSLCLVTGESGMGKSRLIDEMRRHAQLSGVRFLHGSCLQSGGQPFQPFTEILRSLVREILAAPSHPAPAPVPSQGGAPAPAPSRGSLLRDGETRVSRGAGPARSLLDFAESLGSGTGASAPTSVKRSKPDDATADTLAVRKENTAPASEPVRSTPFVREALSSEAVEASVALASEHAVALSMLVPEDDDLRALAAAASTSQAPQGREREWLVASVARFLTAVSRVRPLALYCSDLQWADELTVETLALVARAARDPEGPPPRLLLFGCLRPDEIAGSRLEKTAREMKTEGAAIEVPLLPLERTVIAEMLQAMLGRVTIESEALELLVERTGGSPFAVEATVQEAAMRGAIVRSGASWVIGASAIAGELAPASIAQALDRTLLRLPEADARVFRLLAVMNRPVSVPLLCAIGLSDGPGAPDADLPQILACLRSPHFIQRGWAFGRYHYSLRHAQLRERIYGAIDPRERALLHELAVASLERIYPGQPRYLEDIALHYRRAGSLEKASRAARAAARQARRVYDFARAAALYADAYDLLDALPKTRERSLELADLAMSLAEVSLYRPSPRLVERLTQALEVISESGDAMRLIRVQHALGRTYYALGRNPEAIRCFRELLRLTEGAEDDGMRAIPLSVLGRVYIFMGRFEEACDYLTRAASLLRTLPGAEDELAYALGMLGGAHIYLGHFEEAIELTRESRAIARSIGSSLRVNQADIYEGILLAIRGDFRAARAALEPAVAAARPAGNIIGAGTGSGFLGLTYLMEGDARRAVELCRFGRHHIAAAGGTWTFSMIGSFLAEALLAAGEVDEALHVALETVPIVEGGERWGEAFLHTALGRIHAARGDRAEAKRSFERAIEVSRAQKSPVFEASSRLWLGAFLLSIGEREAGLAEIALARGAFELFGMRWHLARALFEAEAGAKGSPREIVGFASGRG